MFERLTRRRLLLAGASGTLLAAGLVAGDRATRARARRRGTSQRGAGALDRITVTRAGILDSAGRQVVPRGLVTITTSDGTRLDLSDADYARMRDWGFTAQVIRLDGCRLGAAAACTADPAYLDLLEHWTAIAEAHGLYTIFKMTTYDVPSWGAGRALDPDRWGQFWANEDGQQQTFLDAWRLVWRRFVGRAAVLGYDVVNEPHVGADEAAFTSGALQPFYQRAATALRAIDGDTALLVQPGVQRTDAQVPLDDPHVLFAPHFYPVRLENYPSRIDFARAQAEQIDAPLFIGEYGYPDRAFAGVPAWTAVAERDAAVLFDRFGLGTTRPWYVYSPLWSVLNPDGTEQREKLDILSRPYPQRIGGRATGWQFDFTTRVFRIEIDPASVAAPTVLYTAAGRHYPNGFVLEIDGSRRGLDASDGIIYDANMERLMLAPAIARAVVVLRPA